MGLIEIEYLNMQACGFKDMSADIFEGFPNVKTLLLGR